MDPLGSDSPSRERSQLYSSEGLLPEGSRFGGYIVGPCIGHGGMARIYRAEHEGLRRSVALKVLLDGFAQDPEGHERFLREGRIAAAIKHPNVVNIFDVGFQDSTPYLVMELLEGQDLEALMYSQGSMPEAALVDIIVPIVAGLAAVHDAGVIHRDLKPGNIFLARSRNDEIEPKLLDFGISKAAESEQFKLTTARGLLMGTPLYMSPEGIQGGEITPLSDQYSLGVVLYECCTGFNPFAADTLAETVRRVTMGDFPPVSQQNPAVSKRMARIIGRAMSLDPSHRFSGLREMGRELLYLAGQRTRITWSLSFGEVAPKRTSGTVSLSPTPATPAPSRGYGTLGSVAAIVFGVALFGLAGVLLWPSRDEDDAVNPAVALQSLKGGAQATELPPPARPVGRDLAEPQGAPLERAPNVQPPAPSGQTTAAVAAPPTPAPSAPSPEPAAPPSSASSAPAKKEAEPARSNGDRVRAALNGGGRSSERGAERSTSERTSSERGAEGNGARGNARQAASRRRVPQRAPAPARAEATPAEEPKKPDWIVAKPAPVVERRPSTAVGTNNAPIFE